MEPIKPTPCVDPTKITSIHGIGVSHEDAGFLADLSEKGRTAMYSATNAMLREGYSGAEIAQNAGALASNSAMKSQGAPSWACRKGCAYCCHTQIFITPPEALLLAEVIYHIEDDDERISIIAKLKDRTLRAALTTGPSDYIKHKISCVFLSDEDGSCHVYDWRPIVCRSYVSLSRSSCCDLSHNPDTGFVVMDNGVFFVGAGISNGLSQAITEAHLDGELYEFHSIILCAIETPHAAARWQSGERIFDRCAKRIND